MASITFGSVGDIIAICQVIVSTIKSLSAARGSSVEYQGLINELWSLAQALESIKTLLEEDAALKHRGRLQIALQNCRECLERELGSVRKFSQSLSQAGPARSAKDAFWRLRWQGHKNDLYTFRQAISSHISSISLLLQSSGIQQSRRYHGETSSHINEFGKRVREEFSGMRESQKRQCTELKSTIADIESATANRYQGLESQIQSHRHDTLIKLDASHNVLVQLNDSSQRCLEALKNVQGVNTGLEKSSIASFNELLRKLESLLHSSIPDHLQKAPLIYEDASLRKFSVDLEFISSYETFIQVISSHYKGTEGETKIEKREFTFEDKNWKRLNLVGVWTSDMLSGKTVFMRVTFKRATPQGQCPSCKSSNEGASTQTEIICQNCNIRYLQPPEIHPKSCTENTLSTSLPSQSIDKHNSSTGSTAKETFCSVGFFRRVQVHAKSHSALKDVAVWQPMERTNRMFDARKLREAVDVRGGYNTVCELNMWGEVGRELGYGEESMPWLCTSLKDSYRERLLGIGKGWIGSVHQVPGASNITYGTIDFGKGNESWRTTKDSLMMASAGSTSPEVP